MNKKSKFLTSIILTLSIVFLTNPSVSAADARWTPISENDYIFGYTSEKYSCWSGVTAENVPIIEVFSNNTWMKVATGQILPSGSDIKTPCSPSFPIAVGFVWTVMAPSPPAYPTNRYTALYRPRIPDREVITQKLVTNQVLEDQEKCCETKLISKKVPYIAKIKKNGKYVNVIKYKTIKNEVQVPYMESVLVEKTELQDIKKTVPGYTGESGNISIYSSVNAMNAEITKITNGVLCSFGFVSC